MKWSEHDWSIYSRGIAKMLQKSVRKVLGSTYTICKTWLYCESGHVYNKSMTWSEHDWLIYSTGIAKMLQKNVKKVLGLSCTFYKTWLYCLFRHFHKNVRRDPSMINRVTEVANLKSCKKCFKSINDGLLHFFVVGHVHGDYHAKFHANQT